ncbi:MAG: hypothetical protein LBK72_09860 [Bifidobacteriaceae bacterium]|jgi:hypothetical protein|nr:hypothetical protein [Bifidobacteriaceae bacterium]
MRLSAPHHSFPASAIAVALGLMVLAAASCSGADEAEEGAFDREEYCEAMHTSEPSIDAEGMENGDVAAYQKAIETYEYLAKLAPVELTYEWQVIAGGVERMVREAGGEEAATDQETAEFRSAFQTVYADYTENCLESPTPGR